MSRRKNKSSGGLIAVLDWLRARPTWVKWVGGIMILGTISDFVNACERRSQEREELTAQYEKLNKDLEEGLGQIGTVYRYEDAKALRKLVSRSEKEQTEGYDDEVFVQNRCLVSSVRERLKGGYLSLGSITDSVVSGRCVLPFYAERGQSLRIEVQSEDPGATVSILDAGTHERISHFASRTVSTSLPIRHNAIYLVEVLNKSKAYVNAVVGTKVADPDALEPPRQVQIEMQDCKPGDFLAEKVAGVQMKNAFDEVKKLTLRSQLGAIFSGSSRSLIAVQTGGAPDILYSLLISTNETAGSEDKDQFYRDMSASYHQVRILGLPVYESTRGVGLLSTMLGLNLPVRDEDAFLNMYVFYSASEARKFQDGTPTNQLKYNLDYSQVGTQSCNGRIPTRGSKTIYLGFENARMRYTNYVWLSALLSSPPPQSPARPVYTALAPQEEPADEDYGYYD